MVPPKGSDTVGTGLEGAMGTLTVQSGIRETLTEYQPRPGFGTTGKAINVFANMYSTRFNRPRGEAPSVYHFDIEINPVVKVANQKKPKALMWSVWLQMCQEATGELKKALDAGAYDMVKNVYTPFLICGENERKEVIVALREEGREANDDKRRFKVVFQYANKLDLDTITQFCKGDRQTEAAKEEMLTSTQAMNVLFRQDAGNKYKPVGAQGRRFFGLGAVPISGGGVILLGFMQSFRFTNTGLPAMQLDTAYSAFVEPGLLHNVAAALVGSGGGGGGGGGRGGRGSRGAPRGSDRGSGRGGPPRGNAPGFGGGGGGGLDSVSPSQLRKLNEILRNAKFTPSHRPTERVFTMRGLTTQSAGDLKFLLSGRDGGKDQMISVVDYFKQQYNVTVTKPRLPCVSYGQKNYIPMEFVKILPFNSIPMRSLTAEQTGEMIRVAAKRPEERLAMISQWRQKLNYANLPKLKAWGVGVQANMSTVKARVLQPPEINYGANKKMRANFGGWNLKGVRFTKPGRPLKSWAVLSFDRMCGVPDMQQFVSYLVNVLNQSGCPIENTRPDLLQFNPDQGGPNAGIKPGLQQAARQAYQQSKTNPQLIIVIIPRKETIIYTEIKRIALEGLMKPVVTQVLHAAKIKNEHGLDQYCGNVSMKIQCKLGGVTHQVSIPTLDTKTMMIGADVTHPPPRGGPVPPSIAVSVSTISGENVYVYVRPFAFKRAARESLACLCDCFSNGPSYREIIKDFEDMVHTHIKQFEQNSKVKPEKLLVFRDGVPEGQYAQVVDKELDAIRKAAGRFGANYKPKVTFVICAKRHHMRFFASNPGDADRTGNLAPGTVVDTGVCHPYAFNFYLQAHAGLQGTARPTHYIVVTDENGFTADKMQNLCNQLSYSYLRATRSVSMIPVAYYADIIAEKCRAFVYTEDESQVAPSVASGTAGREMMEYDPLKLKKRIEDNPDFNNVGWYM